MYVARARTEEDCNASLARTDMASQPSCVFAVCASSVFSRRFLQASSPFVALRYVQRQLASSPQRHAGTLRLFIKGLAGLLRL